MAARAPAVVGMRPWQLPAIACASRVACRSVDTDRVNYPGIVAKTPSGRRSTRTLPALSRATDRRCSITFDQARITPPASGVQPEHPNGAAGGVRALHRLQGQAFDQGVDAGFG